MNEAVSKSVGFIADILKNQKKKLLFAGLSALFFALLTFPYDDLGDFVASLVYKSTGVYLQFEKLGINLLPSPGFSMEDTTIDMAALPSIKAGQFSVSPLLSSYLIFKHGAKVEAEELFGGDLDFTIREKRKEEDVTFIGFDIELDEMSLKDASQVVSLPVKMSGQANLDMDGEFGMNIRVNEDTGAITSARLSGQPDAEIDLFLKNVKIPKTSLPIGEVIPALNLRKISLRGRLTNSELVIDEGVIGEPSDALFAQIKGKMGFKITSRLGRTFPEFSSYDLKVILNLNPTLAKDPMINAADILLIGKTKTATANGVKYSMKLTAPSFQAKPRVQKINSL